MEQPETLQMGTQADEACSARLRALFDASYQRLVVQVTAVVGDAEEAEELVQEAFVRATAAGGRFLAEEHPEAWLRTAAVDAHRRRRRRRRVRVAAVVCAAMALAVVGYMTTTRPLPAADQPEARHAQVRLDATWWPGGESRPQLRAGTYELPLDRNDVPFTALVTVPEGWRGWYGPDREVGPHGYVGVLLLSVMQVVSRPCREGTRGMRMVADGPSVLVEALTRMPRHRVRIAPRPDDRFGLPGTYLQVRGTGARCPGGAEFELWNTKEGLVPAAGPRARMDLWVVDMHGTPVLVAATSAPGTPGWALRQLDQVVASVELDPRHGLGVPPWVARGGHSADHPAHQARGPRAREG